MMDSMEIKNDDVYGLIGYPLEHSFSPEYFKKKFQREHIPAIYQLFPLKNIAAFPELLSNHPGLKGLNVTIPYKKQIIPYLDSLDPVAEAVAAVNVIRIDKGRLTGYNTDVTGFMQSLKPLLTPDDRAALILGSGGAAHAVAYGLKQLNVQYRFVSRHRIPGGLLYVEITDTVMEKHTVIINATPLGMFPEVQAAPDIPYQRLSPKHLCYDLIYNPAETLFLKRAKMQGARIKNGMEMLVLQAEAAWDIWKRQPNE